MIQIKNIRCKMYELDSVSVQKIIAREMKKFMEKKFGKTETTADFEIIVNGEVVECV